MKSRTSSRCAFAESSQANSRTSLQTVKFNEPVTLDFLDAELENDIKVEVRNLTFRRCLVVLFQPSTNAFPLPQIRKQMIDGLTGAYTISTLVKSQDEVIKHWRGFGAP